MKTGPLRGIASGLRWWRGVPLLCTQAGWVVAKNRLLGCPNLSLTSCLWLEFSKAPHSHLWNGEYLSLRSVGRTKQDKTHHGSFQSGSTVLGTQWGVQTVTLASWKSSSGAPWKQSDILYGPVLLCPDHFFSCTEVSGMNSLPHFWIGFGHHCWFVYLSS